MIINDIDISLKKESILGISSWNETEKKPVLCYWNKGLNRVVNLRVNFYRVSTSNRTSNLIYSLILLETQKIVNHVIYFYYPSSGKYPSTNEFENIVQSLKEFGIKEIK